jgi:hypothetical protein
MKHELLGLNPDNLKPLYAGNRTVDSGVEAVTVAMRTAFEAGEKLAALAAELKINKDLSPAGRLRKFRERETNLRGSALAKLNGARTFVEGKIKDSEIKMMAPPPPEDEDGLRRENNLIAAIRLMKPEERSNLDHRDDEIAGAILRSHHVALGMTKNEQDMFRITWQRQKFPEYADQLNRLNSALGHIERCIPILNAFAEQKANSLAGGFACVS